jgi:hypothetical protein
VAVCVRVLRGATLVLRFEDREFPKLITEVLAAVTSGKLPDIISGWTTKPRFHFSQLIVSSKGGRATLG